MLARARPFALVAALLCSAVPLSPAVSQGLSPLARVPVGEPRATAIVMDASTGEILYSERADSLRYPASVTKVMTFYMAFEALASGRLHLDDEIVVSPFAAAQPPTKLGLRAGERISVRDAMYAMAVHSANDMAMALAEKIGGTSSNFAAMMTLKAHQLGMENSRFVNPNGLPDNRHVSTAHDLAILTRAILHDYPQYYSFFDQQSFTYRGRTYINTNHLLGHMPGLDGLKTGFTNAAGFNLDASAVRNGHRLIVIVMGNSSSAARNANVENLLLTGFDVEDRRDHGEQIASTQDFFEHAGPGAAGGVRYVANTRPEPASDPINLILTHASGPSAEAQPEHADRRVEAREDRRDWWVQVGQFRSRQAARVRVELVSRHLGRLLDGGQGEVASHRRTYVATFRGLDRASAHEACSAVRSHGLPCVAGVRRV
ncbi:MAG: D-alanyl-D-alanine carboxypeptidase [Caulobacteraceae bacterium]|nr:D-alanyl-D-alanine carboxypeptidase [Caulobacteraceae bacterium]